MADYGLTDAGFVAPRAADFLTIIREDVIARILAATGQVVTIQWEADVFWGTVTTVMATYLGLSGEHNQAIYDSFDPANATGLQLDNLAILVGVQRIPATYSTASVTLTGTVGAFVPLGSLVEGGGSDDLARWATTEDVTFTTTSATVVVQAVEVGAVAADAAEIETIVTPRDGWTAVTNADPATSGENRESDAALRKRRQASLQVAGSASLNSIRANLLALDGVLAAVIVDNPTLSTVVVEGLTLDPISVGVVLYPNTLTTAQKEAVALVLYGQVASGAAMSGAVLANVTGLDGYVKEVAWSWATTSAVTVAVVVTLKAGFELDDVEEPIQDAITDLYLSLAVGDAARMLTHQAIVYAVGQATGAFDTATITLNGGSVDIDPNITVLLTLAACNVSAV